MSETTPPVPKSGGSGPFILAAIVMLLLMGGLIYWKMKGGTETAKVDAPKPSATPEQPVLDEAPPPPPPPVASTESSAKPDETKPGAKKIGGGGGLCGTCTGEPNPGLQGALRAKAGQSRSCYEHALRQNAMLAGRMTISMKINQQGQVCNASVNSGLGDPGVANCVVQMFRSSTFPAPTNGCVDAAVPLNFTPKT
jgi:outer membrane biosynthesis protein TonB